MLKRFWFEFEHFNYPTVFDIGCGVTAYDYDDAVNILKERMGPLIIPSNGPIFSCFLV